MMSRSQLVYKTSYFAHLGGGGFRICALRVVSAPGHAPLCPIIATANSTRSESLIDRLVRHRSYYILLLLINGGVL